MKKYMILILSAITLFFARATVLSEPASKEELGKLLFFDPILSKDKTISCASCHKPEFAFADSSATSRGIGGARGLRNTPSSMNMLLQRNFFWDGRAASLEEQALGPIENPAEMNLSMDKALLRLRNSKSYNGYFRKIFGSGPTRANLAEAIAAFERTLETSDSPFDYWKFYDDTNAVDNAVKRGFVLFNEKGNCIKCHFGANFTLNEFRNIGLFNGRELNDSGRASITGKMEDLGKFKTPGLRNVALTAPYMHNGMFKSLSEVIEFYNDPGKLVPDAMNRDSIMARPLGLTVDEKKDLEAFLLSLTDKRFSKGQKMNRAR
jgi:cytochrome c peroxidase